MKISRKLLFAGLMFGALGFVGCNKDKDEVKTPEIVVKDVTGIDAEGVTNKTLMFEIKNNNGYTASVTPDGAIVTDASVDGLKITYSVAENEDDAGRKGWIDIELSNKAKTTKRVNISQLGAKEAAIVAADVNDIPAEGAEGQVLNFTLLNADDLTVESAVGDGAIVTVTDFDGSSVTYDVAANSGAARFGTITITLSDGETMKEVKVNQLAFVDPTAPVINAVSTEPIEVPAAGADNVVFEFTIDNNDAGYTVASVIASDAANVTIVSNDNVSFTYSVGANEGELRDLGTITITLNNDPATVKVISISQLAASAAAPVITAVSTEPISVVAGGVTGEVFQFTIDNNETAALTVHSVVASDAANVTIVSNDNVSFTYTVPENTSTARDLGTITITLSDGATTKVIAISQAGV